MHRIRTSLAAVAVLAGLATTAPPAVAAADSHFHGTCGYRSVADPDDTSGPDGWTGVIYAEVQVWADTATDNPVSATVTCEVWVEGVLQQSSSFDGTGAVTGAAPLHYREAWWQSAYVHVVVDYTSNDTPTEDRWPMV